jgi:heat shock protein HslJ
MMRFPVLVAVTGLASAACAAEPSFVGKWRIEAIMGVDALDASKTTFDADADGRVSSSVGCNRMVGKPAIDGRRITFGPMAATRLACPSPLDQIETRYIAALESVRAWKVEADRLLLLDGQGVAAVALVRVQ